MPDAYRLRLASFTTILIAVVVAGRVAAADLTAPGCRCDHTPAAARNGDIADLPNLAQAAGYPSYPEIENQLAIWAQGFPNLCTLYQIGTSILNRPIWVMQITDNPDIEEFEPEFKYVANIHGDEVVSQAMAMRMIEHLLTAYNSDALATALVNATDIHILPVMNPDGYVANTRHNNASEDLNRNFPSPHHPPQEIPTVQKETQVIMDWTASRNFVLSAGLHGGTTGIVYPWGHHHNFIDPLVMFPETELVRDLCFGYTDLNPTMAAFDSGDWVDGVINGADWYEIDGEMADWNYRFHGCIETTIEFSHTKAPTFSTLDTYWDGSLHNNKAAMLEYLRRVHGGVRGYVRSVADNQPLPASVNIGLSSGTVAIEVTLPTEWNIVSLPIEPLDSATESVFPSAEVVWAYNATDGVYFNPETIEAGTAYWVRYLDPIALTIFGTPSGGAARPLGEGWNLIGPCGSAEQPVGAPFLGFVYAIEWNPFNGQWTYRRLESGEKMRPLGGYWVITESATNAFFGELPSFNPPVPTTTDRGAIPHIGDYHRLLLPGSHDMWFADATDPSLLQIPTGLTTEANAQYTVFVRVGELHGAIQRYGVEVPEGDDANGLPLNARLDIDLPLLPLTCHVLWRVAGDDTWEEIEMGPADQEVRSASIPAQPGSTQVVYRFRLTSELDPALDHSLPADDSTFIVTFTAARSVDAATAVESTGGSRTDFSIPGSSLISSEYMR